MFFDRPHPIAGVARHWQARRRCAHPGGNAASFFGGARRKRFLKPAVCRAGRPGCWELGCSSISLYINSSSSRAAPFLWTSPFFSILTRSCGASKPVWRRAQSTGLTHNNFGLARFCVDNCPVVPELSPGFPTATVKNQPELRQTTPDNKKPGVHDWTPGAAHNRGRYRRPNLRGWAGDWPRGVLAGRRGAPRGGLAYCAGAGAGAVGAGMAAVPGLPSPRCMPRCSPLSPEPWRCPSPPFMWPCMPPMRGPRCAWASKVFC